MKVGFTGTRTGMTEPQVATLVKLIHCLLPTELHHGCCIGSDQQAHEMVLLSDGNQIKLMAHPPKNKSQAFEPIGAHTIFPEAEFIKRNHNIVDKTEELIAISRTKEWELRSGTWATIRYAQKLGRPVHIIYPNGDTELVKAGR